MTLNLERLHAAFATLNPDAELIPIHCFDTLVSTNQTAWELIDQGKPPGTVVIALAQTGGRGQWGRQWQSNQGGLYLSKTVALQLPVHHQAQLTLCSAWGIATILRDRQIPLHLKWPNDLILNQRKLGGILTETKVSNQQITQAVIGVGINWANPVPEIGINLQQFFTQSPPPAPIQSLEFLAALVLQGLDLGLQNLSSDQINEVLAAYSKFLTCIGQEISVSGKTGIIIGVTATGNLRVQFQSTSKTNGCQEIELQPGTISLGYS